MALELHIPQRPEDDLALSWGQVSAASQFTVPVVRPGACPKLSSWHVLGRECVEFTLAGEDGHVTRDRFAAPGIEVVREVWQATGNSDACAVRLRVSNRRQEAVEMDRITSFAAAGEQALDMGGIPLDRWQILCQKRLKNDVPGSYRPGRFDQDYSHVCRGLSELGAELSAYAGITEVKADPFLLIHTDGDCPDLLAGFLQWDRHLAHVSLSTTDSRTEFRELRAECSFDGSLLPPGGELTTQWFVLIPGNNPHELVRRYTEWLATAHRVPVPPVSAPSVWCSWQYYGPSFSEADLDENLTAIRNRLRLPVDVLLIDECWDMDWGNWLGNDAWPSGMKSAAGRIRDAGYRPGIWTCPFLARRDSILARDRSEWLLKREDGTHVLFHMNGQHNFVLDPTFPGVCSWLEENFRRLTHDWGFAYHKMDFTRAVFLDAAAQPFDRTRNLLQAYRMGMEAIRRGAGPDAYLSVCGGHFGGALGIADSQRSGSDVYGFWHRPPAMPRIKQNLMRTWMSRLWHVDPDAMMVRRRDEPLDDSEHGMLAEGHFSDDEAITIAVNQYLGGQMVCMCERLGEIDDERLRLYSHVLPSVDSPSRPLDMFRPGCPSRLLTRVAPLCADLGPWVTVTCINWDDAPADLAFHLDEAVCRELATGPWLAFELVTQSFLGLFGSGDGVSLPGIPPHASRVVRLTPWAPGEDPVLLGTNRHFSGGGVEIAEWKVETDGSVSGRIESPWPWPVTITIAFPGKPDEPPPVLASTTIDPLRDDGRFVLMNSPSSVRPA